MAPSLIRRACNTVDDDGSCNDWWWSDTGMAVRYGIVVLFFALIVGFLVFSYLHAQRRLKKGMPPLGYHRWLVSRRHHPRHNYDNPQGNYMGTAYGGQAYGMHAPPPGGWQQPPPAYNNIDAPPQYQPPPGGTKAMPSQNLPGVPHGQSSAAQPQQQQQEQAQGQVQQPVQAHTPAPTMRY